jgi:hypothetical protein
VKFFRLKIASTSKTNFFTSSRQDVHWPYAIALGKANAARRPLCQSRLSQQSARQTAFTLAANGALALEGLDC